MSFVCIRSALWHNQGNITKYTYFYVSRNPNFEPNTAIFSKTYKIKVGPNVDYILSHILIKFLSGLKPSYISRKVVKPIFKLYFSLYPTKIFLGGYFPRRLVRFDFFCFFGISTYHWDPHIWYFVWDGFLSFSSWAILDPRELCIYS